jgi:hypothetical protein
VVEELVEEASLIKSHIILFNLLEHSGIKQNVSNGEQFSIFQRMGCRKNLIIKKGVTELSVSSLW